MFPRCRCLFDGRKSIFPEAIKENKPFLLHLCSGNQPRTTVRKNMTLNKRDDFAKIFVYLKYFIFIILT